jgi:hypothetical protein
MLFQLHVLTSVAFEPRSKLREVTVDSFAGSPRYHLIEYPSSLSEQSHAVIAQSARALSSSRDDDE